MLETVRHIGYLQLDPTNVVARNHLLILWSRLGQYDRADLDRLMWKERALYETVSLILPTEDRPLHEVRVRAERRGVRLPDPEPTIHQSPGGRVERGSHGGDR